MEIIHATSLYEGPRGIAVKILNRVEPDFAVDLIVRTPQEVRRRLAQQDRFLAEIVGRGKVLYEASHP